MIRDDFYTTGEETLSSGIVVSKWIPDLYTDGDLKRDIADAYALGYIPYYEAPQTLIDLHAISFSNNLTTINFSTIEENRAWGYCWQNATGSDTRFSGQAYGYENDNSLFTLSSSTTNKVRFTNDIQYSQVIQVDNIDFQIETFCFLTSSISNGNAHNGSTYQGHMTTDYTMRRQEYLDFLNGNTTIDQVRYHTPADNTTNYTTLSYSDFNEEKGIAKQVIGDYTLYIIFNEVGHSLSGARYSYKNNQNQWRLGDVNLTPFFISTVNSSVGFTHQKIMYMPLGWSSIGGQPRFTLQNSKENFGPTYTSGQTYHCIKQACTSWYGLSSVNLADFSKTSGMHYEMLRESAFIYFNAGDGNTFVFIPIVRPQDIYKIYTLINSVNTGITTQASLNNLDPPNYSEEQTVALFTEDNTPLYRTEQGDIAQAADPPILQTWQMPGAHNYSNIFDTDDIPDYEPPHPPGGGTDKDEGSIGLNTPGSLGMLGGFTTSYVLNSTQVKAIGEALWSTLQNTDRLTAKNFFALITGTDNTDYSLSLAEVISYFISLKFFPFNLNNVSTEADETAIRVGTGVSAISTGNRKPKKLTEPFIILNGGTVSIPEKWYNYLDLEPNTTCTVYVPYCGTTDIPLSMVSGSELKLTYCVDLITGGMTAVISKNGDQTFPVAALNGSCGFDMLMTGTNGNAQQTNAMTNLASRTVNWTGSILNAGVNGIMSYASGGEKSSGGMGTLSNMIGSVGGVVGDMLQNNIQQPSLYATMPLTMGASTTLSGLILPQKAYVQIRRHNPYRYDTSLDYNEISPLTGYRSFFYGEIGATNGMGFCKCQNVDLSPVSKAGATEKELELIRQKLCAGIYT